MLDLNPQMTRNQIRKACRIRDRNLARESKEKMIAAQTTQKGSCVCFFHTFVFTVTRVFPSCVSICILPLVPNNTTRPYLCNGVDPFGRGCCRRYTEECILHGGAEGGMDKSEHNLSLWPLLNTRLFPALRSVHFLSDPREVGIFSPRAVPLSRELLDSLYFCTCHIAISRETQHTVVKHCVPSWTRARYPP